MHSHPKVEETIYCQCYGMKGLEQKFPINLVVSFNIISELLYFTCQTPFKTHCTIHQIEICPVDSVIHQLNDGGLIYIYHLVL